MHRSRERDVGEDLGGTKTIPDLVGGDLYRSGVDPMRGGAGGADLKLGMVQDLLGSKALEGKFCSESCVPGVDFRV